MPNILPFDLTDEDILSILPNFKKSQDNINASWIESLNNITKEKLIKEEKIKPKKMNGLPEFIKIGELKMEESLSNDLKLKESYEYLLNNNMPALVSFGNQSAILGYSEIEQTRIERVLQISLMNLFYDLNPDIYDFTLIDLENFGLNFSFLTNAISSTQEILDANQVNSFLNNLVEEVKTRNKRKGSFTYLYESNEASKNDLIKYHFIFIASYETLNEEQRNMIAKFILNNNSAKVGIYFFISFKESASFESGFSVNSKLPKILQIPSELNNTKIKIKDSSGLDMFLGNHNDQLFASSFAYDESTCRKLTKILKETQR